MLPFLIFFEYAEYQENNLSTSGFTIVGFLMRSFSKFLLLTLQ